MKFLNKLSLYRWFRCNVLNKHQYFRLGDKDLYDQDYWHCSWCNRVKYINYDKELVAKKSKEIREAAFRKIS